MKVAARFSGPGQAYEGLAKFSSKRRVPQWTGKVRGVPEHLMDPIRWTTPRKIFVNSMSDLFHPNLPDVDIDRVVAVMAISEMHATRGGHTFQVLTKRAERLRAYASAPIEELRRRIADAGGRLMKDADAWHDKLRFEMPWPLKNVWWGVSAEDQPNWDERTEHLRQTPAAVRFVSIEPQLGPIDCELAHADDDGSCTRCGLSYAYDADAGDRHVCPPGFGAPLDWLIVGGESGPGARPFHVEWARSIVKQCADASVACFVKQLGAHVRTDGIQRAGDWWPDQSTMKEDLLGGVVGFRKTLKNKKGSNPDEWPPSLRVRQFPATPPP